MEQIAPILKAVTSVGWLIFAFVALFVLKDEVRSLIGRLKKGEFLGQKFELGEDLKKLETSVAAATKETEEALTPPTLPENQESRTSRDEVAKVVKEITEQAATSPKAALITLGIELEKRALQALAVRGLVKQRQSVSTRQAILELGQYGFPNNLLGSLSLFEDIRAKILHGATATDADALSALDSGLTILRVLDALPAERNIVYDPSVTLYSDETCTTEMPGVKGVLLKTITPGGAGVSYRIYPTTRVHFEKGREVAWEWSGTKIWGDAWYRSPLTGEIAHAWGGSMEFVGRNLDDLSQPPMSTV